MMSEVDINPEHEKLGQKGHKRKYGCVAKRRAPYRRFVRSLENADDSKHRPDAENWSSNQQPLDVLESLVSVGLGFKVRLKKHLIRTIT